MISAETINGQHTAMPRNVGPAHPLGPYAPHPTGKPSGEPRPDGQYDHAGASSAREPRYASKPAKPQHGTGPDFATLPNPTGQYSHAVSHDAPRDSGSRGMSDAEDR